MQRSNLLDNIEFLKIFNKMNTLIDLRLDLS